MTLPDLFVIAAAGSYVVGYLIINQVVLRLFVMAGTIFYIAYYALVADEPLWTAIWTSVALALANAIGLWLLLARQSRRYLSQDHRQIYDRFEDFQSLPPGDFRALLKAGEHTVYDTRATLIEEGFGNDTLYFLLSGEAEAKKLGHRFPLPAGIFVGEVSYMLQQPASATITVAPGSEVLSWKFETLRKKSKRPRFKVAFEAMVSRDLCRKVGVAVAPDENRQMKLAK